MKLLMNNSVSLMKLSALHISSYRDWDQFNQWVVEGWCLIYSCWSWWLWKRVNRCCIFQQNGRANVWLLGTSPSLTIHMKKIVLMYTTNSNWIFSLFCAILYKLQSAWWKTPQISIFWDTQTSRTSSKSLFSLSWFSV